MNGTTTKRSLDRKPVRAEWASIESPAKRPVPMRFLKADFYRTFAIGFALGAVMVFTVMDGSNDTVVPSAIAAPAASE